MTRIFISYSRKDLATARQLAGDLEQAGYQTWWDISSLKGGDDWVRVIPAAIETCEVFLLLLSPFSIQSQWVAKEVTHALNQGKRIIPLMIAPCAVPFEVNTLNYLDFTGLDYPAQLDKLLASLASPAPLDKPRPQNLPPWLATVFSPKFLPLLLGGGLLLLTALLFLFLRPPAPAPTPTPTATQPPTLTATETVPPPPPTASETPVPTRSATPTAQPPTASPTPSLTASLTLERFQRVELCILPDISSVWVRTGPERSFEALPTGLTGEDCLLFSGRNAENTWLMIAPRQPDHRFAEYEYGWIRKDFLAESGQVSLPAMTPIPTFTRTPLPTPTLTPSLTPSLTFTPSATPTASETPLPTDTRVPTWTPTEISTLQPTATP